MLGIQADAVLVIVHIGGVLQEPGGGIDGDGDDAVVLPGGMVQPPGVPLVLCAEEAAGVGPGGEVAGGGDGLGVLLGLREVNCDIQIAVLGGRDPLHVAGNAVSADVVGVLGELVVPVGGRLGAFGIETLKLLDDLRGAGGETAHEHGVEHVAVGDGVLGKDAALMGVVHQLV